MGSEFFFSDLEKEYERCLTFLEKDNNIPSTSNSISPQEVLKAHFLICDYFLKTEGGIGGVGPRDFGLLLSAVARQHTSFGACDKWTNPIDRCATLFFGIIKDHPFYDANKRTAFLVAVHHLLKSGRVLRGQAKRLERVAGKFESLAVQVASNSLKKRNYYKKLLDKGVADPEVLFISHFFKKHTRKVDKRIYLLTYREFNARLQKYGYYLDDASGNFIHVVTKKDNKIVRIKKIGFPGRTKEMGKKTIKEVLKAAGLTPQNGIDSEAFFKEADPLPVLIPKYYVILKRLRDK